MINTKITRIHAFLIHLSISLAIFLVLLYFILVQWYPEPLFSNDGGWRVIRIIVGVDLVLGPLLTLIVFKPGKKGLKFDLVLIAIVQISALTWGVNTTYNERPAAVIYAADYFTPVPAYLLYEKGVTDKQLKTYGESYPIIIFSDIPVDQLDDIIKRSVAERNPIYLYPEFYTKFSSEHIATLRNNAIPMEKFIDKRPEFTAIYMKAKARYVENKDIIYIPLHSREKWVIGVYDTVKVKFVDTLDIDPTEYYKTISVKDIKQKYLNQNN